MTDAGEKLGTCSSRFHNATGPLHQKVSSCMNWKPNTNKFGESLADRFWIFTDSRPETTWEEDAVEWCRAELERAAGVVANMHGESATKCAAAIRKLKE